MTKKPRTASTLREARALYASGMSFRDIAREFGVTRSWLSRNIESRTKSEALRQFRANQRRRSLRDVDEAILSKYIVEKKSMNITRRELGVSCITVRRVLEANEVKIRTKREALKLAWRTERKNRKGR